MLSREIVNRLKDHSGLPVDAPLPEGIAFADKVAALKRGEAHTAFDVAVDDVLDCLQQLNVHNHAMPDARSEPLEVEVAYAMSGMTMLALEGAIMLCRMGRNCEKLLNAGWKIGCAWDSVLAGDMEDIRGHVEIEAAARNID